MSKSAEERMKEYEEKLEPASIPAIRVSGLIRYTETVEAHTDVTVRNHPEKEESRTRL
ncbi:MAG: hypothetical protein JSV18_02960 [Candidatus Bathyarchaeota archaeon]|nr:MAG: hypothetical protein JSV18_02960 [Candidatus Bathyarchaeota archaeon]